jgi:hypothetical protein
MHVVYPVCCGVDVHATQLTACLRRASEPGQIPTELREFGTTLSELGAFRTWLIEQDCPIVAMESTGVYWQPIYHVLAEVVEVVLANARDVRQRPGKKTDKADAAWIAELLAHGLIEPSFIRVMKPFVFTPPDDIRSTRASTCCRKRNRGTSARGHVILRARKPERKRSGPLAAPRQVDTPDHTWEKRTGSRECWRLEACHPQSRRDARGTSSIRCVAAWMGRRRS